MYPQQTSLVAEKVTLKAGGAVARAVLFAALTGIGALLRVPASPVPVTMQVFFVLLSGMLLGPSLGASSQALYLFMGLCGAPFFAAPPYAGPAVLFGPTGGYLWGFVAASWAAGWVGREFSLRKGARPHMRIAGCLCAGLAGIAAVYLCGTAWLGAWLSLQGSSASLAFDLGVKPFILVDLAKATGAAAMAGTLQRNRPSRVL